MVGYVMSSTGTLIHNRAQNHAQPFTLFVALARTNIFRREDSSLDARWGSKFDFVTNAGELQSLVIKSAV